MRSPYRIAPWGRYLATRSRAAEIRVAAAAAAPDGPVVLDFTGVEATTNGVMDELVCRLAASGRAVVVVGANEDVAETVRFVVAGFPAGSDALGRVTIRG